jgi:hypothetical protein
MSNISNTRGNKFKMQLTHIHYKTQKHFFSNIIFAILSSLPDDVVLVDSSNIFENRVDKFGLFRILELIGVPTSPELEVVVLSIYSV